MSDYVTKNEIIKKVLDYVNSKRNKGRPSDKKITSSDVTFIVESTLVCLINQLKQEQCIQIRGLGTFAVELRKQKKGHCFSTGKTVVIPERKVIVFNPSPNLYQPVENNVVCSDDFRCNLPFKGESKLPDKKNPYLIHNICKGFYKCHSAKSWEKEIDLIKEGDALL